MLHKPRRTEHEISLAIGSPFPKQETYLLFSTPLQSLNFAAEVNIEGARVYRDYKLSHVYMYLFSNMHIPESTNQFYSKRTSFLKINNQDSII